jgi:acyl-CoA dehydrogenase
MFIVGEISIGLLILFALFFFNISLITSSALFIVLLLALTAFHGLTLSLTLIWVFSGVIILLFNLPILRRQFITVKFFPTIKQKLPVMSETEQKVLEAGDVWWEKELLTGRPDWQRFLHFPRSKLTDEEEQFLNHQVNVLCGMLTDFEIIKEGNLSKEAWEYIKKERFLGLVIPKKYNGHEFSALAHSTIIMKIASRSYSAAVSIMVPNAVGLAEFILQYGTKQQKSFYLPRFVAGEEIPCFALTEPGAGSDAGSISDEGIVCYGEFNGKKTLGISLTFDKRYITLAPIATMIGLAFKLHDPDHLLGGEENIGITLAMIPSNTPGVERGHRHSPLLLGFLNGPVRGDHVFIPIDYIIGGVEARGQGWSMMMEGLSVGRGLSLPALSTATAKLCYRMTSAYVNIREQFHTSIGYFEGIKEPLARIACLTYLCEATRYLTVSAIDHGLKPSVASAITKYHLTEMSRKIVNDSMDIHGGKAIQLGPSNYLGLLYIAQPINITVEGANILTRNLIIFGQGALRCHPYLKEEVVALSDSNLASGLKKFDRLFFKHIGYSISNFLRSFVYGITGGKWIRVPVYDSTAPYYRQLTRMSVALAVATDLSIGLMGGALKRRERLSARLGDILSYLYLASATLKYYEDHDRPISDLGFVEWIQRYCLYRIANAFDLFFVNFPHRRLAKFIKKVIFPWGNNDYLPLDTQDHHVADVMMQATVLRERITENIYLGAENDICKRTDAAFILQLEARPAYQKLQRAIQEGRIKEKKRSAQIIAAKNASILSNQEAKQLLELDRLRLEVIQVDEFDLLIRKKEYDREEIVS